MESAVFRLSKLSDYAVVLLSELGRSTDGAVRNASGLATATGIAEPTVAKVLKLLASGGLVTSQRGAHGGYRLARKLTAIPIADVIAAIEGPIALTACVDGHVGSCEVECSCLVRGRWDPVNSAIRRALSEITLADMACPAWALPATARLAEPVA